MKLQLVRQISQLIWRHAQYAGTMLPKVQLLVVQKTVRFRLHRLLSIVAQLLSRLLDPTIKPKYQSLDFLSLHRI